MQVDLNEYVLYMVRNSGLVDEGIVEGLETQFHALDASGDGLLGMEDFGPEMALRRDIVTFNGRTTTNIEVVDLTELGLVYDASIGRVVDKEKYDKRAAAEQMVWAEESITSDTPEPEAAENSIAALKPKPTAGVSKVLGAMAKSEAAVKIAPLEQRYIELQQTLATVHRELKLVKARRAELLGVLTADDTSPAGGEDKQGGDGDGDGGSPMSTTTGHRALPAGAAPPSSITAPEAALESVPRRGGSPSDLTASGLAAGVAQLQDGSSPPTAAEAKQLLSSSPRVGAVRCMV
jgi:hypothetical protein